MKSFIKSATVFCIGAMSLFVIGTANAGPGPRGGFRGGVGIRGGGFYRPSVGFRGGFGYRSYYRPYFGFGFYPSIGLSIGALPYGYWPFYYGPDLYYCYDGIYYRPGDNNTYQVVAPPVGAETPKLPEQAKSLVINGEQYFELNGVYYKEVVHQDGTKAYLIAGKDGVLNTGQNNAPAPKVGDIVNQLPPDCRTVSLAGKTYYLSADDVYYEEQVNGNTTTYRVAGVPTDQDQNNKQQAPVQQ